MPSKSTKDIVIQALESAAEALDTGSVVSAMAVLIRQVALHNWGFFSREDHRFHLQTVDTKSLYPPNKVRFWLENRGQRTFEWSEGPINSGETKILFKEVVKNQAQIEHEWVSFMISNRWLSVRLDGRIVTVTAYPGSHNKYTRTIDLSDLYPGAYDPASETNWDLVPPVVDLDEEHAMLRVGPKTKSADLRNHLPLGDILFLGTRTLK